MLRIITTQDKFPKSYAVDPAAEFLPGQIAWLTQSGCGQCNGGEPVGIIDDIKNKEDDSTLGSQRVCVWDIFGMVIETDQYDTQQVYEKYDLLYCGLKGKIYKC